MTRTLVARDLTVEVGPHRILDRVSIELGPGDLVALVGPNGAGKSTLLHALAGDTTPSSGSVELDGEPLERYTAARLALRRAVLPQQALLQFAFTARQVVAMGRAPHLARRDRSPLEDEAIVEAAMERADTAHLAGRTFPTLSGGERSRVSLARVLAQATPVILLDEPTASLDVRHQELVMRTAAELAASGACVLAVLHDLNLAAAYATSIAVMHEGRIADLGAPHAVLREDLLREVFGHALRVLVDPLSACPLVLPERPTRGSVAATHEGGATVRRAPLVTV